MMRRYAIICGGRDRTPTQAEEEDVCRILEERNITDVVHGGARGTDRWADRAARRLGLRVHVFYASWRHGGIAGPERNGKMAAFVAPTADPVCIALTGGSGTASMQRAAVAHGVEVIDVLPRNLVDGRGGDVPRPR
jgi:predicted Rossmann-fold nucleotide-binding protein